MHQLTEETFWHEETHDKQCKIQEQDNSVRDKGYEGMREVDILKLYCPIWPPLALGG